MVRESMMTSASRMSLSALNQTDDPDRQVRIWLLSSVNEKGTIYYRVAGRFMSSGQTWQVNRRYSEFLMLRDTLVKYFSRAEDTCPGCMNYLHAIKQFDFPKKHFFVSKSQMVVNYRIKALRSFMNLLASWTFSNAPKCPTCGGFAFDIVRNFVLEGADAVGDSNMGYIRESFVVSTFTEQARRSSITRRNSFIPASGSHTLNGQRQRPSDLPRRNTIDLQPEDPQAQPDDDAYETFNNYLVRQPSSQAKALQSRSSINIPQHRDNRHDKRQSTTAPTQSTDSRRSSAHPQQSTSSSRPASQNGSFLFYQDGVERGNSVSTTGSHQPPSSTGSKRGILKNRNEVRSQNDSYLSLGASSTTSGDGDAYQHPASKRGILKNRNENRSENNSYFSLGNSSDRSREEDLAPQPAQRGLTKSQLDARNNVRYDRSQNDSYLSLGGSDLEDEYHSHHPSVLSSPTLLPNFAQPPPTQKYVGPTSNNRQQPRSTPQPKSSQGRQQQQQVLDNDSFVSDSDASLRFDGMQPGADDDSDDDIDITGVAIQKPLGRRKSASGEGLWQPWELAKAG